MILLLLGLFVINSKSHDKKEAYIKTVAEWHIFMLMAVYALSISELLNMAYLVPFFVVANAGVWGYAMMKDSVDSVMEEEIAESTMDMAMSSDAGSGNAEGEAVIPKKKQVEKR